MTGDRYVVREGPSGTRLAGHALWSEGAPGAKLYVRYVGPADRSEPTVTISLGPTQQHDPEGPSHEA